jgi:hypothetical protein
MLLLLRAYPLQTTRVYRLLSSNGRLSWLHYPGLSAAMSQYYTKVAITGVSFSEILVYAFLDSTLRDLSIVTVPKMPMVIVLLFTLGDLKLQGAVASDGMTFIPSFILIYQ